MVKKLRAPEIKGGPWINSKPLAPGDLRGRAVLVDFWTYSCVNCLRTLPYLKEWHRRYAKDGLVIIGVHSPEFEFEKDPENVRDFMIRNGIDYPVVLDNDYSVWSAFANKYWPHHYFIDGRGYIRYDHAGEGGYGHSEQVIQALLKEIDPKLEFSKVSELAEMTESGMVCYPMSAELYTGFHRGVVGNPVPLAENAPQYYQDKGDREDGAFYLSGRWEEAAEYARHSRKTKRREDYLAIAYHGLEVNAVMGPSERGAAFRVYILRDGEPLPHEARGADIREDETGTFVEVDLPRMYRLIDEEAYGRHELKLLTGSDQFQIYAFTFGSCAGPAKVKEEQRKAA
ncbi:MAG: thioredoxin family protein [Candidatus Aquicultorales bacterium]